MDTLYFDDYGYLEWLETKDYYTENWTILDIARGEDGVLYDIVKSIFGELRYTID